LGEVHSLAQRLPWAKVREAFGEHRNWLPSLWVAPDPRPTGPEREGTEAANLDALATGQGVAHLIEQRIHRQLDILGREMALLGSEAGDEFGSIHIDLLGEQREQELTVPQSSL
jgi:hypothetical protein